MKNNFEEKDSVSILPLPPIVGEVSLNRVFNSNFTRNQITKGSSVYVHKPQLYTREELRLAPDTLVDFTPPSTTTPTRKPIEGRPASPLPCLSLELRSM